jgi:hypothetical protein
MKWLLIIWMWGSNTHPVWQEFDDRPACETAKGEIRRWSNAGTDPSWRLVQCFPKSSTQALTQ